MATHQTPAAVIRTRHQPLTQRTVSRRSAITPAPPAKTRIQAIATPAIQTRISSLRRLLHAHATTGIRRRPMPATALRQGVTSPVQLARDQARLNVRHATRTPRLKETRLRHVCAITGSTHSPYPTTVCRATRPVTCAIQEHQMTACVVSGMRVYRELRLRHVCAMLGSVLRLMLVCVWRPGVILLVRPVWVLQRMTVSPAGQMQCSTVRPLPTECVRLGTMVIPTRPTAARATVPAAHETPTAPINARAVTMTPILKDPLRRSASATLTSSAIQTPATVKGTGATSPARRA
jgi:hypothetical protein